MTTLILLAIGFFYFIQPEELYNKINPIGKEFEISMNTYENMSKNFEMEKYYETMRIGYLNKLDELNFRDELNQEHIIEALNNCTVNNNIQIYNIKFSEDENVLDVVNDIEIVESKENNKYQFMSVAVEFKLRFDELLNFMDDINRDDISITNIRIITWEGDLLFVVLDMKFYAVALV